MLRRVISLAACSIAVACGGGGGGTAGPPPVAGSARLAADAVEIGTASTGADLTVQLAGLPNDGTSLLQVAIELPPALTLPATDRLQGAQSVATLDGDFVGARFVVLCGDARNVAAGDLTLGALFRVHLVPSLPRQPGNYTVRLQNLRASSRSGASLPVDPNPIVVPVVIR